VDYQRRKEDFLDPELGFQLDRELSRELGKELLTPLVRELG